MRVAWGVGITTGWGETEVFMEVSSRRLAIVQHRHPPARGLLSLISLLSAFLLTGIKRNQAVIRVRLSDSYNRLEWRTLRDPRFTKQRRLLQRGGSLAAHDARTPDHLHATMIHFQQRTQSPFQFLCLSLNQPILSLSRCCAVLSYPRPRAACCPCRRRRSHSLPVPRGDLSLRPRATCTQARLSQEHTTATGRGEHHDTTRILTSSPASSDIKI